MATTDWPGDALARPDARAASSIALRALPSGAALSGTRRTAGWPWRVRMMSSPASARCTSSVNWPFASVTDIRIRYSHAILSIRNRPLTGPFQGKRSRAG